MRENNPYAYLQHMKDAAKVVHSYASNHTLKEFASSDWDEAAAIRNLEIIGEAAK